MFAKQTTSSHGWLAFELNVLRRLKFQSAALPLTGEAHLGAYLKRWDVRVRANDPAQWAWVQATAEIQNNTETLSEEDLSVILEDAYVPRHKLQNPALRNWFNESDAWWFDNVRQAAENFKSPAKRAAALNIGMKVGDYLLSFTEETRELRQPLSKVYRRLNSLQAEPFNNRQKNECTNKNISDFLAESFVDMMFLRLPQAHNSSWQNSLGQSAWREEWIRGNDVFWAESEKALTEKLGSRVETKFQYLWMLEEILKTASHIENWAIAYAEGGIFSTSNITDVIAQTRRVDTIFTKDFSELTGTKAVIITA